MLNRFVADYLETLAQADFRPVPKVAGRLLSCDGLLMEATGLTVPVGTDIPMTRAPDGSYTRSGPAAVVRRP